MRFPSVSPFPQQLLPSPRFLSLLPLFCSFLELTLAFSRVHAAQVKTTRSPVRARLPAHSTLDLLFQRDSGVVSPCSADLAATPTL